MVDQFYVQYRTASGGLNTTVATLEQIQSGDRQYAGPVYDQIMGAVSAGQNTQLSSIASTSQTQYNAQYDQTMYELHQKREALMSGYQGTFSDSMLQLAVAPVGSNVSAIINPTPPPEPAPTPIAPVYDPTHGGQGSLAVSPPPESISQLVENPAPTYSSYSPSTVVATAAVAASQPSTIMNYIAGTSYFDAGKYAGGETPLAVQSNVTPIYTPSPLTDYGQVKYLQPIVEERQQALQAYQPNIATGTFVGNDAQYADYTKKVSEANAAVSQYNATVERYNTAPPPNSIQLSGEMSGVSKGIYDVSGRVADVIKNWGEMADIGAQNIQSRLPEPISVLYGGAYQVGRGIVYNTPESVVRLAGMAPGGVEMIARNPTAFPALATAGLALQYEGLKEGVTQRPLQTVGEFAGMTAVGEGIAGGIRSIPYRKMFGYSRTAPEPITPITREMIFGQGTLAPLENIVANAKATPGIIRDAISTDKMFGRGTLDPLRNVATNLRDTPSEIVQGIQPRKMFGTAYEPVENAIANIKETPSVISDELSGLRQKMFGTAREKPEVNLQGEYFNKAREDVQWKDYESLKESNRWDIIDKKYPTPEPTPVVQPRTVNLETDIVAQRPVDIPEEWYGKYTDIGYGGEYSRIGIGGERTSVVLPKDVVSRKPPTDAEMTDIYAKYNERQNSLYPYGHKSELADRLSTPGEELVPIPKAKLPESVGEGRVTFRRDLTGEMNKRFETAQRLNDMEARSGVTTAQDGQVLILKEVPDIITKTTEVAKTVEKPRVVNLESDLVKLERDYSVPEQKNVFPYGTSSKLTDRIVTPNEENTVIPKGRLSVIDASPQNKMTLVKKDANNVLNPRWTQETTVKYGERSTRQDRSELVLVPKSKQRSSQNAVLMEPQNPLEIATTEQVSVSKTKQRQKSNQEQKTNLKLIGVSVSEMKQNQQSMYSSYQVTTPKQRQRTRMISKTAEVTDIIPINEQVSESVVTPKQKMKSDQMLKSLSKYDTDQMYDTDQVVVTKSGQVTKIEPIVPKERTFGKTTGVGTDTITSFAMFGITDTTPKRKRGGSQGGAFPERRRFGGVKSRRERPWHPAALEYVTTEELQTGKLARHVRPKDVTQGLFKEYAKTGRPIPTASQFKKRGGLYG